MHINDQKNHQAYDTKQTREAECVRWLDDLSKTVRNKIIHTALAGIGNGLGIIGQAGILAWILYSAVVEGIHWHSLTALLMILTGIMIFRAVCIHFFRITGFEAGARIKHQVRSVLLEHLIHLGPLNNTRLQAGEYASIAVEQVDALANYYSLYLPQRIIAGCLPFIIIVVVLPVNWVVGLIFILTGPLIPLFMALIGMGAASTHRKHFLAMSRMGGYFLDRLQGMTTLKLFGQAEKETIRIEDVAGQIRELTMSVLRIAFISSAVLEFFSAIAIALVAVYVGLGLLGMIQFGPAETINLREALFVLLLAPEFFFPLKQLAAHYHDRAAAIGAADSILGFLEIRKPAQHPVMYQNTGHLITFKNVGKHFNGRVVLDKLNFHVDKGEKIALVGVCGSGKTTILNIIMGFESVSTGQVFFRELPGTGQGERIAWVGQNAYIFRDSIRNNISLVKPEASQIQINQAAHAAGITGFLDALPAGLNTIVGEQGFGLSGGQVQRVALARAFLNDAPIILLDEPTASLDRMVAHQLLETIKTFFKDKTVIIATHDRDVMKMMDRQIILPGGG